MKATRRGFFGAVAAIAAASQVVEGETQVQPSIPPAPVIDEFISSSVSAVVMQHTTYSQLPKRRLTKKNP